MPQISLNEVTFFSQRQYQCGPAALATILDYRGVKVVPDDLIDKVYIPQRKGSLQIEMIATARSYGLLSYKLKPHLSTLLKEINAGNPVLVFQNLASEYWPQWHYAVITGYDLNKAEFTLRSGTNSNQVVSFSSFERTWKKAGYWAYVFMPLGEIPFTANPYDYVQACYDLQKSKGIKQSLISLKSGAKKWPETSILLMALGNAEFSAGNYSKAITVYQRELTLRPKNATIWNNLAYAFAANHCKKQALKSIHRAKQLSPNDANIQQSLLEINHLPLDEKKNCSEP